ncbi:Zn-dependent exopeptidase [Neoconidiobolus thromboides FSU 785]|nr:Zn-dependent exopeptidase [Neoconidiobolus thromboides FSU 785]
MKLIQLVLASLLSFTLAETAVNNEGKRLIQLSENEPAVLMTDDEVLTKLIQKQKHFFDITDLKDSRVSPWTPTNKALPTTFKYQTFVKPLYNNINIDRMKSFLTSYSNFNNRYYKVQSGADASNWLLSQIKQSITTTGYTGPITVENFSHSFLQKSIIVRITGSDATLKDEIVVIGAHLDSINQSNPTSGRAPGADDDGSGTTLNVETIRVLLAANFRPKRTVEFHFYAGEEGGLLGSQAIAQSYSNQQKNVIAMTQFDMVGYLSTQNLIGFVTDYTNAELTELLRKAVTEYCSYGYMNKKCGYACSDHASWNKYGYKSAFPFEDKSNPNIHTTQDTLAYVNFNHIKEFVKLAIAFLVEVGEI